MQNIEAKVGRKGFIKIIGDLPMAAPFKTQAADKGRASNRKNHINMEAHGLEMRLRNSYTGTALHYPCSWESHILASVQLPICWGSRLLALSSITIIDSTLKHKGKEEAMM